MISLGCECFLTLAAGSLHLSLLCSLHSWSHQDAALTPRLHHACAKATSMLRCADVGLGYRRAVDKGTLPEPNLTLAGFVLLLSCSSSQARTVAETVTVKAPAGNRKVSIEAAPGKDSAM